MKLNKLGSLVTITILSFTIITACGTSKSNDAATTTDNRQEAVTSQKSTAIKIYTENGVAIKGTDPVAYFQESKPVSGSDSFTYEWKNATWKFASAENRDLFASNPEKYAPKYGGYCAWAVSQGSTAPIDPSAWKIVDGKLYLNYDKRVQKTWEKDIPGNIAKADRNWPGVLNK